MDRLKKYSYVYALIGICLVFLLWKLLFLNPKVIWDESVYLGMGKYIYSAGSSGLWEMIRPLGLPLITGIWWKLGLDEIIVSRIFSILISIGCIVVTFFIAKELFDKRHGLMSALILACTPIFFFYSDYILTDHISTLFLMLSILFLLKDRFIIAGIFGGIACWFKFTHVLYILALALFVGYKLLIHKFSGHQLDRDALRDKNSNQTYKIKLFSKKNINDTKRYLYVIGIILFFMAVYFFSNYLIYKEHLGVVDSIFKPYLNAAAYSNNPYQNMIFSDAPLLYIFYYPYNILFNHTFGFLIYAFLLIYFIKYQTFIKKESHALLLFVFFTYLAHFSIIAYKVDRFSITFLPFMAIYAAYGIIWLIDMSRLKMCRWRNYGLEFCQYLIIVLVVILFGIAIYADIQSYRQNKLDTIYYTSTKAGMSMTDVEKYFDNNNIDGPILITNPLFTAYSDKRYIGAYDVLNKNSIFVNEWELDMDFNAVAYMDSSIPCLEIDVTCVKNKEKLKDMIKNDFRKADSYIYRGENVTFYVR